MKKTLPLLLLLFWGANDAFSQPFNWSRQLSNTQGGSWGYAVSTDRGRNSYVTGSFTNTITFPNNCGSLTALPGMYGGASSVFVAKFNSLGVCQWAKKFECGIESAGYSIYVSNSGGVYITGFFIGGLGTQPPVNVISQGESDIFIAHLDQQNGALQWIVRGGGQGRDMAYSITADEDLGDIYVTGFVSHRTSGSATFGSTSGPACLLTGVGPSSDIFVVKYSPRGVCRVAKRFGGANQDIGYGISMDSHRYVYVTGVLSGKAFIARTDSMLNQEWVQTLQQVNGNSTSYSISVGRGGDSYIAGQFSGAVSFSGGPPINSMGPSDAFIASFDTAGALLWAHRLGGPGNDVARSIHKRGSPLSGYVLVTGSFELTANFGGSTSLTSDGGSDIFVASYYFNGVFKQAFKAGGLQNDEGLGISLDSYGMTLVIGVYKSNNAAFIGTSPPLTITNNVSQNTFVTMASP
jgi:hypothetical protein